MNENSGEIRVFNPNKEISKEVILEVIVRNRDAFKQARTGEVAGQENNNLNTDHLRLNQVRALNLIINAQREMITISRPVIFFRSTQAWRKKHKEDEDQKKNPFEKEDNDYNKLTKWLSFLKSCANAIVEAEKTPAIEDDFLIKVADNEGDHYELTSNFYDMLEDLESSYEQIYLLMLTNKIVSAGIEEDEELTYKEKEKLAIERIVEA